MTCLIDKSAYERLGQSPDATTWIDRIERGLVHISTVTRLEIGYSMRSAAALTGELEDVLGRLVSVHTPPWAEDRAVLADAFAAATAVELDAELWTGDPELLSRDSPWRWRDLR